MKRFPFPFLLNALTLVLKGAISVSIKVYKFLENAQIHIEILKNYRWKAARLEESIAQKKEEEERRRRRERKVSSPSFPFKGKIPGSISVKVVSKSEGGPV